MIQFGFYYIEDCEVPVNTMCDRARTALETIRKDVIMELSDKYKISLDMLHIEITESAYIDNPIRY